jgi:hypothetical protein
MRSGTPPTRVATTRRPLASASSTTFGVPSVWLGRTSTSQAAIQVGTRSSGCGPRMRTRSPSGDTIASTSALSGPPPTIASVASGMWRTTAAHALARSSGPFSGLRLPTYTASGPVGRPSSARAAARSRGWNRSLSTPFITIEMRSRATPSAAASSASGFDTATTRAAFGRAHDRSLRGPGSLAIRLMSLPWSFTTAGTPRMRAATTEAKPSG